MPTKRHIPKVCEVCAQPYMAFRDTQRSCGFRCRAKLQHREAPDRLQTLVAEMAEANRQPRPFATVEAAKRARLARERAQGYRTYTIETDTTYVRQDGVVVTIKGGWAQRPGAADIDGSNGL